MSIDFSCILSARETNAQTPKIAFADPVLSADDILLFIINSTLNKNENKPLGKFRIK